MLDLVEAILTGDLVPLLDFLPVHKDVVQLRMWQWTDASTVLAVDVDEDIPGTRGDLIGFFVAEVPWDRACM